MRGKKYNPIFTVLILAFSFLCYSIFPGVEDPPSDLDPFINTCENKFGPCPYDCEGTGGPGGNGGGSKGDPIGDGGIGGELVINPGNGAGDDPIDVGRTQMFRKATDVAITVPGNLEFRIERLYTTGWMQNVYNEDYYPMMGKSWHLNIDSRILGSGGTEAKWVILPNARPRLLIYNSTDLVWRSDLSYGDPLELSWNNTTLEYTLNLPSKASLRYNQRGRLIAWRNKFGNEMTFIRELYQWGEVTIDRLVRIEAPAYDGRVLVFSYDSQKSYLVSQITFQSALSNPTYTQILTNYEYSTDSFTDGLLTVCKYKGTLKGVYYEYGSYNPNPDPGEPNVEIFGSWERTLAVTGKISSVNIGGQIYRVNYPIEFTNYRNEYAWIELSRPIRQQMIRGADSNPAITHSIGSVYGDSSSGQYCPRIWKGDFPSQPDQGNFSDYQRNWPQHDVFQTMHSSDYASYNVDLVWDQSIRRITERKHPTNEYLSIDMTYQTTGDFLHKGVLTSKTDYMNRIHSYAYDTTWNRPNQIVDPYSRTTTVQYDSTSGHPQITTYADSRTVTNSFNPYGYLSSSCDSLMGTTQYTYQASGRGQLQSITYPEGSSRSFQYNPLGLKTQITSNEGPTISYTYDVDKITQITNGTDVTTYTYDDWGNRTSVCDANQHTISYVVTPGGALQKIIRQKSGGNVEIEYGYNIYGNVTAITDPNGNSTEYEYDAAGKKTKETRFKMVSGSPVERSTTFTYGGNCSGCGISRGLQKITDPKNQIKLYERDDYNRITSIKWYDLGDDPDVDPPARTVSYSFNHSINQVLSDMITQITDSAIPFTNKSYTYQYDGLNQLTTFTHPDAYLEEFFYDQNNRLTARRDVDGGLTQYEYDSINRIYRITDPFGKVTQYYFNEAGDSGPRGTMKRIEYGNGTKTYYEYDAQGRVSMIENRAADSSIMSSFEHTYDGVDNIIRIDLADEEAWVYQYDEINRLIREERRNGSDTMRWYRNYSYDNSGNRTETKWFDGTQTLTTTSSFNELNEIVSRSGGPLPSRTYHFDNNGNMDRYGYAGDSYLTWDHADRLKKIEIMEGTTEVQYEYNIVGSRILKRTIYLNGVPDGRRTRYFYNGLNEEIIKESVPGAHDDSSFSHTVKEDGNTAYEWYVYDNDPSGAYVTAIYDSSRRSNIIKCMGQSGNGFAVGDYEGYNYNPNDIPWNDTKRVVSFWYKGGFSPIYVCVSTSIGHKFLQYYSYGGTNQVDGNGNVNFYLGNSAACSSNWLRFDRNIEADWESVSSSSWLNTDGLLIRPTSDLDYDFYMDELRLSNCQTMKFNSIIRGGIGRIACQRSRISQGGNGSTGLQVRWFAYNHRGDVPSFSSDAGSLLETVSLDAWGNRVNTVNGALIDGSGNDYFTTRFFDDNSDLYNIFHRWYDSQMGFWISRENGYPGIFPYRFCFNNPLKYVDVDGLVPETIPTKPNLGECKRKRNGKEMSGTIIPPGPGNSHSCHSCVNQYNPKDKSNNNKDDINKIPTPGLVDKENNISICVIRNKGEKEGNGYHSFFLDADDCKTQECTGASPDAGDPATGRCVLSDTCDNLRKYYEDKDGYDPYIDCGQGGEGVGNCCNPKEENGKK
jgi:RHS repeat-associated protein